MLEMTPIAANESSSWSKVALSTSRQRLAKHQPEPVGRVAEVERLPQAPALPLDVAAAAEVIAGAGEHDNANGRVVVGVVEGAEHLLHGVYRHRVVLLRAIDRDARDAAFQLLVVMLFVHDLVEREPLA